MGATRPRSSVLTEAEEVIVVEFRRRTLLPLDDVLGYLCKEIPALSRLPEGAETTSKRRRFALTKIGYVHIDVRELRYKAQDKLFMFLAISRQQTADPSPARNRSSRTGRRPGFTQVTFLDANTKANGAAFLREVVEVFPYQIHTVLTDNRSPAGDRSASWKDRRQETAEAAWPSPTCPRTAAATQRSVPLRRPHLRPRLRCTWHPAPSHQTLPPLDEWSG
jgi:hypothetical protein